MSLIMRIGKKQECTIKEGFFTLGKVNIDAFSLILSGSGSTGNNKECRRFSLPKRSNRRKQHLNLKFLKSPKNLQKNEDKRY